MKDGDKRKGGLYYLRLQLFVEKSIIKAIQWEKTNAKFKLSRFSVKIDHIEKERKL